MPRRENCPRAGRVQLLLPCDRQRGAFSQFYDRFPSPQWGLRTNPILDPCEA